MTLDLRRPSSSDHDARRWLDRDAQRRRRLEPLLAGYRPMPGAFDEMMDRDGRVRAALAAVPAACSAALGPDEIDRRFARRRPASARLRRLLPRLRGPGRRRAALAAQPRAAPHRRRANGQASRPAWCSAPSCSKRCSPTSTGRRRSCATARCRRRWSPAIRNSCGRWSAVAPAGGRICASTPSTSARSPGRPLVGAGRPHAGAVRRRLCARKPARDLARAARHLPRAAGASALAPFFQAFQADAGGAQRRRDDSRVCMLTPGPLNETYFEHAYLARYLGFLLVEGEDLTVRDDGVFIRTVSGLKRADVLLRRLDARLRRSARTERALAPRRARPRAGGARRHGRDRQCAGLRHGRSARRC